MKKYFISTVFICSIIFSAATIFAQNIYSGEPVQIVGQFNGYVTIPYNADYRTMNYRKVSTNINNLQDSRGQWSTTINVYTVGGDVVPINMPGGNGSGFKFISGPEQNRNQYKWSFNGAYQSAINDINNATYQSGQDMGLDMSNEGFYTFVFHDTDYVSSSFYCGFTSALPVTPSRISEITNPDRSCNVAILLSAGKSPEEHIYVRYRMDTNSFIDSTFISEATGTGVNYSAILTPAPCGSTVYYYVFSSTRTLSQLNSDNEKNRSLATLRYDDNSGNNYSYTFSASPYIISSVNNPCTGNDLNFSATAYDGFTPYSFNWSGPNGFSSSIQNPTITNATTTNSGTYAVLITDYCGNSISNSISATVQSVVANPVITDVSCNNNSSGAIALSPSGGTAPYTYLWNNGSTNSQLSGLAAGNYQVTITDFNNCSSVSTLTVSQQAVTITTSKVLVRCFGKNTGSISASGNGGSGSYNYLWNNGATTSTISNLYIGTYTVTVWDQSGCSASKTVVMTQNPQLVILVAPSYYGNAHASVSGGFPPYTYSWNTVPVQTNMIATGLIGGGTYKVTATDFKSCKITGNIIMPACNKPTGLSAVLTSPTDVTLSWNSVSGASSYDLQYLNNDTDVWTTISVTSASASLTGLPELSTFEWRVRSNCIYGGSSYATGNSFSTQSIICNDPMGHNVSGVTSVGATLIWNAVNSALTYSIQYRVQGSPSWSSPQNTSLTTYNLTGLSANTNYEWQVSTNCQFGTSNYTSGSNFTTLIACGLVNGFASGTITTTTATLSWTSVVGATSYSVQYRTIGAPSWSSTSTASTSITLTGLTTGRTYEAQVSATCSGGSSAFSSSVSFTTPLAASILSRSAYIQVVTPTSFRIRWRTSSSTNTQVRYGTTMSYGSIVTNATSLTEHEILISGLTANTKYYYTIGSTTQELRGDVSFYCITSLPTGSTSPFRIWATGDFGTNTSGQTTTRDAMVTYCGSNLPKLWLWLGDNAYNGGQDAEFTTNVFNIYPNQMKNIPVYPCLGNHDYNNIGYQSATALGTAFPYFTMFTCPTAAEAGGVASGTEKYYSYNYGNAHFIVLDSYGALNASGSAMYNWLQSDLIANTQRFTVAMWHHSPYTMGTHNSDTEVELIDMRNNINPLLEQYKVDLVLNGHSHVYERTWLIKGHTGLEATFNNTMKIDTTNGLTPFYLKSAGSNFDGTVYCVCGCSGQGGAITAQGSWPHAAMRQYSKALFGSMIIDFNSDTLDAQFVTSTGTVYDRFKIVKSGSTRYSNSTIIPEIANDIEAYPNPFKHELNIRFKLDEKSDILVEVYNTLGENIFTSGNKITEVKQPGTYEFQIADNDLKNSRGMLIVKIITSRKVMQTIVNRMD